MHDFTNKEIAKILNEISDLMAIDGQNKFKIRAYQNAARKVENMEAKLSDLIKEEKLETIKGIGKGIAATIREIFCEGHSLELEELKRELPSGVLEMINIPNLGPKRAHQLYYELGLQSILDLEKALRNQEVRKLKGFGPKTEEKILQSLSEYEKYRDKIFINEAKAEATKIIELLAKSSINSEIEEMNYAGSTRRHKEIIGDIDILISTKSPAKVSEGLSKLSEVGSLLNVGNKKVSIRTEDGLQVDFRIVASEHYAAALHYFTGSQAHNIRMRQLAKQQGLKLNEYGLVDSEDSLETFSSEKELFNKLGLDYIIPELREDRGEIEAAQANKLPKSIELKDIKGDLHLHSRYSDGAFSIKEMADAAKDWGYEYIAITDHSQSLRVAHGMSVESLEKEMAEIAKLNEQYDNFHILKGIEVDILADGSLDYSDEILAKLDLVIASIHSNFNMSQAAMTERIIKAITNPHVDIFAHPQGRILGGRKAYQVDMNQVINKAAATGTCLEINASPYRLDLDDQMAHRAIEAGAMISINTDAHHYKEFSDMEFGIGVARRGWLEKSDVINTFTYQQLMDFLKED